MGPVVKVVALGVEAGVKIDCARRCGTCPECLCRKKDEIRRIGGEREREREREREEKAMSNIKDFPCHLFIKARFVFSGINAMQSYPG